jgi:hypothetical protein
VVWLRSGTERLCRMVKYALRGSKGAAGCAGVLPALAATLREAFRAHQFASPLFAASETVRAFGGDAAPTTQAQLQGMVDTMLAVSFVQLRQCVPRTLVYTVRTPAAETSGAVYTGAGLYAARLLLYNPPTHTPLQVHTR